jgi:hypothetical protein
MAAAAWRENIGVTAMAAIALACVVTENIGVAA